jgi:hypothetical protein
MHVRVLPGDTCCCLTSRKLLKWRTSIAFNPSFRQTECAPNTGRRLKCHVQGCDAGLIVFYKQISCEKNPPFRSKLSAGESERFTMSRRNRFIFALSLCSSIFTRQAQRMRMSICFTRIRCLRACCLCQSITFVYQLRSPT